MSVEKLDGAAWQALLANGRAVSISRLYANNYILKAGPEDSAGYRSFGEDLLAGRLCGVRFADMPRPWKRKFKPLVAYFLMDALSSGRLDDYADWVEYAPVFNAFMSRKEIEAHLYVYGYRSAENDRMGRMRSGWGRTRGGCSHGTRPRCSSTTRIRPTSPTYPRISGTAR